MNAHDAWNWCWLDPKCLAFPVAVLASLAAVARRIDHQRAKRRGIGCVSMAGSCFAGATISGISAFALEVGIGSLCTGHLEVVTMGNLLAAVAIDWSAESASGAMKSFALTILEAYLKKVGLKLEPVTLEQASPRSLPDEPTPRPPSSSG